jgi:vacuolar-type H+-ATPase subunit H
MTETSYPDAVTERPHEQSTTDGVKDSAQQVASQVGEKARDLREQAGERAREQVNERSTQAGEQATEIAQALRRAGGQLREEGKSQPAAVAEGVADRVERLGEYLREADADRILGDVEDFARRQPWLVGAGGLVAGILASRLLKASSSRRYESGNGDMRYARVGEPRPYGELSPGPGPSIAEEPAVRPGMGV